MKRLGLGILALGIAATARPECAQIVLGQTFTFYAQTSRFSTGAAYDATGSPAYRLYEEETGTPILTGSLALLDDAGTTGLYSEQIAATAGNGFEIGKCYVVSITATVDSVAAAKAECLCISFRTDTSGYVAAAGGAAIDDNPWDAATRSLTILDEDSTTLDLNATTIGTVTTATTVSAVGTGAIAAASFGAAAIDAAAIAPDAIGASELATDAIGAAEVAAGAIVEGTEATGWNDISAADVWAAGTRTLTAATNITSTGGTTVPQTGDSFARIGATGSGLTSLAPSATALSTAVWTSTIAGYLTADLATWASRGLGMIEADGPVYRFTTNALEQGAGGSALLSSGELAQLRQALGITGTVAATTGAGTLDLAYARLLSPWTVTQAAPLSGSKLTLRIGADYYYADSLAPVFACSSCPDMTGATAVLRLKQASGTVSVTATIDTATGATKQVHADISSAVTSALTFGAGQSYDVQVTLASGHKVYPWTGLFDVLRAP